MTAETSSSPTTLRVTAPGRVCLFGEHQDYLGLPVVPCAISLRMRIDGMRRPDPLARIELPDIGGREEFRLDGTLRYTNARDYFRSAVNVLRRNGFRFSTGVDCRVHGEIPINAGTSSSSALVIAWIAFLGRMSDQARELSPEEIARFAHEAEVTEFGEPGGMMDHLAAAHGGVLAIDFVPEVRVERLEASLGAFVLGNSGEPKETTEILARVKGGVLAIAEQLRATDPGFSLQTVGRHEAGRWKDELSADQFALLEGTIRNRDMTRDAREIFSRQPLDHRRIGRLLCEHQKVLRDALKISTPKIDRMIDAAVGAGAFGAKINGSGGGGCMFAYAPDQPERVAEAIRGAGGDASVIRPDGGVRFEQVRV